MIHVVVLEAKVLIYLLSTTQVAALYGDNFSTKIPTKYSDYANIFLSDLAMKL